MNLWRRADSSGAPATGLGQDRPADPAPGAVRGASTRRGGPSARGASRTARAVPGETALRRFVRFVLQRVAVVVALLILFYATSLHGISIRTFILAAIEILFLYWIFRGVLSPEVSGAARGARGRSPREKIPPSPLM